MRRIASRWSYWWNLGYSAGLFGKPCKRRIPSLYRTTYREGLRQGMGERFRAQIREALA